MPRLGHGRMSYPSKAGAHGGNKFSPTRRLRQALEPLMFKQRPAPPHFEEVTETTGIPVTREGARMMYTRYAVGAALATGCRTLELACGGGNGLGLVGASARSLIGGDISGPLLRTARSHYGHR